MTFEEQSEIRILEQELFAIRRENQRLYDALDRVSQHRDALLRQDAEWRRKLGESHSDGFSTSFPSE